MILYLKLSLINFIRESKFLFQVVLFILPQVRKSAKDYIEGYHVKFRVKPTQANYQTGDTYIPFTTFTVTSSSSTMYMLRKLKKHTWYEIRVQPFFRDVEGMESNTQRVQTLEDSKCYIKRAVGGFFGFSFSWGFL